MAEEQVTRFVYFYRIDAGVANGQPVDFPTTAILEDVDAVPLGADRYMPYHDTHLFCWIDRTVPAQRVRLASIRRRDLPLVEREGTVRALDLAEEEGIAESIHVVFFPNGIVGADFNVRGPRLTALTRYLIEKADSCPAFTLKRLLRRDFEEALEELGYIRLLDLRVRHSYIANLQGVDQTLADAFRSAAELGDMDEFELILLPKKYSRHWDLGQRVKEILRRFLQRDDLEEGVTTLKIKGERNGTTVELDLLREYLVYEEAMVRLDNRTRAVDSGSAYDAISRAYHDHFDEIQGAPGI